MVDQADDAIQKLLVELRNDTKSYKSEAEYRNILTSIEKLKNVRGDDFRKYLKETYGRLPPYKNIFELMQFLSLFNIVNALPRIADRQSIILYASMQEQWDRKIKYIFPGKVFFICMKKMEEFHEFCKNKYSSEDELKDCFMNVVNMMNTCKRNVKEIAKYIAKFEQEVVSYVTLFAFDGYTGAITYKKDSRSKNIIMHKMMFDGEKLSIYVVSGKDKPIQCLLFNIQLKEYSSPNESDYFDLFDNFHDIDIY
ncbi:hypothetical protein TVAG_307040 [Trichomonas vaginalis G3]|uniref:Uncharacterized protein n=1 Tax=Trichomonas vaginalis (strain ATCC PRA-98 / G3) TaxID=412133 RepID=A2FTZ1_TRIV3|nr:hypothetical protein TVAGG3_0764630 [Trichomonas vaginalis G3]EAX91628.1 hypothetical protein TVAG_307040 [Trichomonas vaginalis G3]KAI5513446.1 hypothetical protein TVAGG3_0764630 [Trichomonas vaginalis G3]|eukprot:XP_001304558.1 hypothetical protein [Trichomonas vaginalis G3]